MDGSLVVVVVVVVVDVVVVVVVVVQWRGPHLSCRLPRAEKRKWGCKPVIRLIFDDVNGCIFASFYSVSHFCFRDVVQRGHAAEARGITHSVTSLYMYTQAHH